MVLLVFVLVFRVLIEKKNTHLPPLTLKIFAESFFGILGVEKLMRPRIRSCQVSHDVLVVFVSPVLSNRLRGLRFLASSSSFPPSPLFTLNV